MDAAYDPQRWSEFGVAVAGASAALAGLLVVAVSINVREILADANLIKRGVSGLITLVAPLVASVFLLVPGQSGEALGIELLVGGVVLGVLLARLNSPRHLPPQRTLSMWVLGTAIPLALMVVSTILAGIGLLTGSIGGLYWIVVAVSVAVIAGLAQAWVLLIEILR